jgi:ABC-type Fe3+-hydroxamate transport system substrate-binding protein
MLRKGLLPLLAGTLLILAGCEGREPIGGATRDIPRPKAVSLSPSVTEVLSKTTLYENMIGRTMSCDWPSNVLRATVVTSGVAPDFEKIAGLKPDYVVYDGALYSDADLAKFKELNIRTLKWDPHTLKEYEQQSLTLSRDLGGETGMSEYIDSVYRSFQDANAAREKQGVVQPRVGLMTGSAGSYLAPGKESLWADLLTQTGSVLVGPPGKIWAPLSTEEIIKQNPQVIITEEGKGGAILRDPALKSVSAVQRRLVYELDSDILLRRGGRLEQLGEVFAAAISKIK